MPMPSCQHPDEELTNLMLGNFKVLQKKQGFRFSLDAILVAHFAQLKKNWRVCDMGTGTGVIPLVLTAREPSLTIDAVEIQRDMADMARRTMAYNGLTTVHVIGEDIKALGSAYHDRYDLVISNPPYFPINRGKISPVPEVALARHEIACTLEQLLATSARLLRSNGHLVLIHRPWRLTELLGLCQTYQLEPKRLRFIHPTVDQSANLIMLEAVKGAKGELMIQPPLIIYEGLNQYSPEILRIYGCENENKDAKKGATAPHD